MIKLIRIEPNYFALILDEEVIYGKRIAITRFLLQECHWALAEVRAFYKCQLTKQPVKV